MSSVEPYVVIDRERMKFIGRASSMEMACMIANLEPVDSDFRMIPLDLKSRMATFGVLELMLLYKNTTGQAYSNGIHNYSAMIDACYKLALEVPVDARSIFDLEKASALAPKPTAATTIPAPPIVVRSDPNAPAYVPPPPVVKGETKTKIPKEPGIKPAKGATGRVWEIADLVRAEMNNAPVTKEMRTLIVARCAAAGINEGTAATQYGKWKGTQS